MFYRFWSRGKKANYLNVLLGNIVPTGKVEKPPEYYAPNHPKECERRRKQKAKQI